MNINHLFINGKEISTRKKYLCLILNISKVDAMRHIEKSHLQIFKTILPKDFFIQYLILFFFSFEVVSYVIVPIAIKPTRGMKIHLHSFCPTTVWKVSPMRVCRVLVLLYFPSNNTRSLFMVI